MNYREAIERMKQYLDDLKDMKTELARCIIEESECFENSEEPSAAELAEALYIVHLDYDPEEDTIALILRDRNDYLEENLSVCVYMDDKEIEVEGWTI